MVSRAGPSLLAPCASAPLACEPEPARAGCCADRHVSEHPSRLVSRVSCRGLQPSTSPATSTPHRASQPAHPAEPAQPPLSLPSWQRTQLCPSLAVSLHQPCQQLAVLRPHATRPATDSLQTRQERAAGASFVTFRALFLWWSWRVWAEHSRVPFDAALHSPSVVVLHSDQLSALSLALSRNQLPHDRSRNQLPALIP